MMRLPRETLLYVLKQHGVQVECDVATSDGRQFCTLTDDEVAEAHWLPDPIGGDMLRYLARKFGIPRMRSSSMSVKTLGRHTRTNHVVAHFLALLPTSEPLPPHLLDGPNPDARYRRWVSLNSNEPGTQTLRQARNLWEVFGGQREAVQHIPRSGPYMLVPMAACNIAANRCRVRMQPSSSTSSSSVPRPHTIARHLRPPQREESHSD